MRNSHDGLSIAQVDPRHPDAQALIAGLSRELAQTYDFDDDGSGNFDPEAGVGARGLFLVGYLDGVPVACGAIRPLDEHAHGVNLPAGSHDAVEVKRMYVVPADRGRGFSRVLLAALETAAAERGFTTLKLETGDRQRAAIALYQKAGYRPTAKFGIYVNSDRSVCFEKSLPITDL